MILVQATLYFSRLGWMIYGQCGTLGVDFSPAKGITALACPAEILLKSLSLSLFLMPFPFHHPLPLPLPLPFYVISVATFFTFFSPPLPPLPLPFIAVVLVLFPFFIVFFFTLPLPTSPFQGPAFAASELRFSRPNDEEKKKN
jgi:hypothetical protein